MNLGKPLRAGFVTVATIALLLAAGPAFAHAHLLSEDPAAADKADASAPSAPVTELRLTFSEELNAAFSKVQLKDSMGMAVDGTAVALDPKDPKVIVVTLAAPLAKGEYEVDWTAVSNDGHKTTGTYKVNVAQYDFDKMETALSIARFLHYSAAIQLFGTAVFETWIASKALSSSLLATSRRIAVFNAWLLFASAVLWLAFEAGNMGNGWADVLNPSVISLVITATSFGKVWIGNMALAAVAVIVTHVLGPRKWAALAVVSTLCLGDLAFIGHAVADTGALGLLSQTSQVVHLLSSGFWFGSLLSLVLVLRQIRDPRYALDTDIALRRFSGLGHLAVALALGSGLANSWFVLRDSPLSFTSTYQLLLAIKIVLVGMMCVLALVNRYVFVPMIPTGDPAAKKLRDGTVAELIIGTIVVALVSVIGLLSPS